jgi:GTP-binding protein
VTRSTKARLVGIHAKDNDLTVNALRAKQLTNIRAAGKDDNVQLTPPVKHVAGTGAGVHRGRRAGRGHPKFIRLRKKFLTESDRKRASRAA